MEIFAPLRNTFMQPLEYWWFKVLGSIAWLSSVADDKINHQQRQELPYQIGPFPELFQNDSN